MVLELGKKTTKPVTTVQDRVSTFSPATILDIFIETSGQYAAMFVEVKQVF